MNKFTKLGLCLGLLATVLFSACKKEYDSIETIDGATLQSYIAKNNLTSSMIQDPDKTGFYYQVITAGTGSNFRTADSVFYNLTVKSLTNGTTYLQSPLVANLNNLVGYTNVLTNSSLATSTHNGSYDIPAIRTAILSLKPGGVARILLPSYLAFGKNGAGTIPSNELIDLIVTTYPYQQQALLDDNRITTYLTAKGLTATKDPSSIYYIVNTVGTGDAIADVEKSTAVIKYTGRTLDGTVFDSNTDGTYSTGLASATPGIIQGWKTMIPKFKVGAKFRILVPSNLGYGRSGHTGSLAIVPSNAVLDYDIEIVSITN
ncbi:FKBP-type peptidyl-prolyl cis-trans isomerase [Pedobacter sp. MR22-3]|uniref:FKBP-type peptidyl-prolyl cis-trans isomerase n=1 Tax=Pedobacter sp. MR22-3 TaxID=2994552 RepID=UPI002247DFEE|nr:FKBP-type peptidyl-prolyl cis-trans isomerase [Pedobacter sp. MR22-3]MCX2583100.1 FKBP-type peptidyl-prolyl cis-trans isomerase [Pedobacter sp. MR22-3]